jgi:hypothetical protein
VDDDVQAETDRVDQVLAGHLPTEALTVHNLKKAFIIEPLKGGKKKDVGEEDGEIVENDKTKVLTAVNGTSFSIT